MRPADAHVFEVERKEVKREPDEPQVKEEEEADDLDALLGD